MAARAKQRNRRTRAHPPRPRLDLRTPLRAAGAGVVAVAVLYTAFVALDRPVEVIVVEAPFLRVSAIQIEAAVQGHLDGGFLSADLGKVAAAVTALPWVDRVRIRREWPAGLKVSVTEQVAAARWGENGLLNTRGELFIRKARHVPAELPRLAGPAGTEWLVAQRYLDLHARLLAVGYDVAAVVLDPRGAWSVVLANGIEIRLGREAADLRIVRFVSKVAPVIAARPAEVSYVDLRYSNGFAVGWRAAGRGPSRGTGSDV